MAQHDYSIANGTGSAVRSDLNDALAAIVSLNSGATEPATTFAFQLWADTTANVLKLRNSANNAWITLRQLDGDFTTVSVDNGTAAAPSVFFNASGTDTGFYSSGTDAVDVSTAGTRRLGVGSAGDVTVFGGNVTLNAQGDLRFADSDSSNWVAFQAPATVASNVTWTLPSADGTADQALTTNGSGVLSWADAGGSSDAITEGNTSAEVVDTGSDGHFKVITEGTEAIRVDSSRRLLVGTNAAYSAYGGGSHKIQIAGNSYNNAAISAHVFGSTTSGSYLNLGLSRNTTVGSHTVVQNNDQIGAITFNGSDGSQFRDGANIISLINGTPGSSNMPCDLLFATNSGSSSAAERVRIDKTGRLLAGTTTPGDLGIYGTKDVYLLRAAAASIDGGLTLETSSSYGNNFNFRRSGGAFGSKSTIGNGSEMGAINFFGTEGTYALRGAHISGSVDGTPSSNAMYGRLGFFTNNGSGNTTERLRIQGGGSILIANSPLVYPSTDNSTAMGGAANRWTAVYAVNGSIQTSDERQKTEITESALGTEFVKSLRPVSYKWIEGGKRHTGEFDEDNNWVYESVPGQRTHWGFIAQEVKQAVDDAGVDFGGWVLTDKDDPDSEQALRYDQFIAPLTKALQEALAKIETLETANASLEARLTALENA